MKIIKVVVDKLPPSCLRCLLFDNEYGDCKALDVCLYDIYGFTFPRINSPDECPLEATNDAS